MRPIFASLTTLECESLPEVSERIFQAGCDPFPELKTKAACLSERNSMTTPPPDPNTAVFPGFSSFTFNSPWVKKGGAPFPSCSSHSVRAATLPATDEPIGQQRCQRAAHS